MPVSAMIIGAPIFTLTIGLRAWTAVGALLAAGAPLAAGAAGGAGAPLPAGAAGDAGRPPPAQANSTETTRSSPARRRPVGRSRNLCMALVPISTVVTVQPAAVSP